jgi:Ankyrin repeats (3 copies)
VNRGWLGRSVAQRGAFYMMMDNLMRRSLHVLATGSLLSLLSAPAVVAAANDTAIGTFVVKGKVLVFKHVSVTRTSNPAEPGSTYLVVLVSDVAVPAEERKPARLFELARAGKVRAVRVVWKEGFDSLTATPYHSAIEDNGQPTEGGAIIDLRGYDERRLDAQIKSKALGQDWHFNASLKADVVSAPSTADDFADPVPVVPPTGLERDTKVEGGPAPDPTALKRTLGRLGYEYTGEAFSHAVKDANVEAVALFLRLGMSPDTKDSSGSPVLMSAAMMCTREPAGSRVEIVKALIAGKAKIDPKDENGSTPLLWSVSVQCPTEMVEALLAAGANVNAQAKGGGTPLTFAKIYQRADLIALLQKAGATK